MAALILTEIPLLFSVTYQISQINLRLVNFWVIKGTQHLVAQTQEYSFA